MAEDEDGEGVGEGSVPLPYMYILSRDGPPHNSVWLLLQVMLQSEVLAGTAPMAKELPQKHSPPYSTPLYR